MRDLYEVSTKYESVLSGFLTHDEEQDVENGVISIDDLLLSIEDDFNDKVINLCSLVKNIDSNANEIDIAIARLKDRKYSLELAKEKIVGFVKTAMENLNIKKVNYSLFDISIAKNPDKLVITDEKLIPDNYLKIEIVSKIDKNKIKEDIKNGELVYGVELQSSNRLVIK